MIRSIGAAIVGIIVAMLTIQAVQMLGHLVYPPPADIEFSEPEQVREFMASLPVGSILFIGAAWAAGTLLGTITGSLLSPIRPLAYAIVVGGIVLAGAGMMLLIIPHPWWFTIAAPIAIVAAAYLGMILADRLRPAHGAAE